MLKRKDLEIFKEKLEAEAKVKAKKEAEEEVRHIARKLKEKEEAETAEKARLLELAPDKEKLSMFADKIEALTANNLDLKSKESRDLFTHAINGILNLERTLREKIEEL